jgi:hypothetical protein
LDFRQLFKLRLVVAALGETQRLGWWNSGVLTGTGEFLFQQGFPRSAPFAQTRAGFRVAQLACDEALAIQPTPGGPITCQLFRLTPQLEDAFENERNRRRQLRLAAPDRFRRQPAHRGVSGGLPGRISRLVTFTWLVSLSAQLTLATTIGLLVMIGAMAVTVPHAKCPLLVGGGRVWRPQQITRICKKFFCEATGMTSQNSLDVKKLLWPTCLDQQMSVNCLLVKWDGLTVPYQPRWAGRIARGG